MRVPEEDGRRRCGDDALEGRRLVLNRRGWHACSCRLGWPEVETGGGEGPVGEGGPAKAGSPRRWSGLRASAGIRTESDPLRGASAGTGSERLPVSATPAAPPPSPRP